MAADVEALLAEHADLEREGFLSNNAGPLPKRSSLAGLKVGAYTLRDLIGQGGMGQVWLAERSDGRFEGRAAVKLLNASLMGRGAEERFVREGSLLARLRHPGIANLIDAGVTTTGQPYLVLEYVDGEPIDVYCDRARLGLEARLEVYLEVLSAVAFAHANLVVHRDLKPPNILVGKDGHARLLDFGIAKLIDPEASRPGGPALTREGESVLTPEYAAPEQLTGGAITTATDVYALGIVLYLLLTGQHPAAGSTDSPAELVRAVVDREARRPSDAVVSETIRARTDLEAAAAARGVTPGRLRRALRGDLDNIVARALRRNPGERYPSVESLAVDIRRHLNSEPVSARPDSMAYRAMKFVRRNRGGVAAAGLVVAAAAAGTAGIAWQAREARMQRDAAEAQLSRATAASEFTSYLLSVGAPTGRPFTVGELLDQAEALIDKQFARDATLQAELLAVVGQEYMISARFDRAQPIMERAAAMTERSSDPALRARVRCPLAFLLILQGEKDKATSMIGRAIEDLPDAPQYEMQRGECLLRRSEFGYFTGDGEAMIRDASEAILSLDRAHAPTTFRRHDAQGALAYGYYLARRNVEAERTFAQVVEGLEATGRGRTLAAADTLNNWSLVHFLADISKAEPLCRKVVEIRRSIEGSESISPTATFNHAGTLVELARFDEAIPLLEATIRSAKARGEHRIEFDAMMELAGVYIDMGNLSRAAEQLDALSPHLASPRFNKYRQAQLAYYRACLHQASGAPASARTEFAKAIEIFDGSKAKIAMNVHALIGLARVEQALGDPASAAATADRALSLAESFVEKDAPSYLVGLSLAVRGEVLAARGAPGEAKEAFASAHRHLEKTLGAAHPATQTALKRSNS